MGIEWLTDRRGVQHLDTHSFRTGRPDLHTFSADVVLNVLMLLEFAGFSSWLRGCCLARKFVNSRVIVALLLF